MSCNAPAQAQYEDHIINKFGGYARVIGGISVFQLYLLNLGGIYPSSYLISCYALLALMITTRIYLPSAGTSLILALFALEFVSAFWSPVPIAAVRDIIYSMPFLALYMFFSTAAKLGKKSVIIKSLTIFTLAAAGHSLVVIAFRLSPPLEAAFLTSRTAGFFILPSTLIGFGLDFGNNVTADDKAGGFFLNANVGAAFSEMAFYIAVVLSRYKNRTYWGAAAIINFAAAIASGSKSALALIVIAPFVSYFVISVFRRGNFGKIFVLAVGLLVVGGIFYAIYINAQGSEIMDDADTNAFRRQVIWTFAWQEFLKSPLLGLGFGGWTEAFAPYGYSWMDIGLTEFMPPHNSLISYWAQSGIFASLLGLSFIFLSFYNIIRVARSGGDFVVCWATFACVLGFFVHSLGENYTLFNEPHLQFPLAALLGWASTPSVHRRGAVSKLYDTVPYTSMEKI